MEFNLDDATEVLRRTPATLRMLLEGLPDPWIHENEGPDTWSPFAVLGHLIHGEKTDWIPRARIILDAGEARAFDPFDRFAQFRDSQGRTISGLLDDFAALRAANIEALRGLGLTEADLERRGIHPAFGPVTLRELLATWVTHDLGHIAQIARVMAKRYAGAVGPWREYLPVLHR